MSDERDAASCFSTAPTAHERQADSDDDSSSRAGPKRGVALSVLWWREDDAATLQEPG